MACAEADGLVDVDLGEDITQRWLPAPQLNPSADNMLAAVKEVSSRRPSAAGGMGPEFDLLMRVLGGAGRGKGVAPPIWDPRCDVSGDIGLKNVQSKGPTLPPSMECPEKRRNPCDGKVYTFDALLHECEPHWSSEEVRKFWQRECIPVSSETGSPQDQVSKEGALKLETSIEADGDAAAGSQDDELRRNPDDGKVYTLAEFLQKCKPHWTSEELKSYWETECVLLKGEGRHLSPARENAELRSAENIVEGDRDASSHARRHLSGEADGDAAAGRSSGQHAVRKNPYDGKTYTFDELVRSCGTCWSHDEVKNFWDKNCQPLGVGVGGDIVGPRVISLGSWCCVKSALREMGLGGPSLPFDWVRITLRSVLRMLHTDFKNFLEYHKVLPHQDRQEVWQRDYDHDDVDDAQIPFKDVYICDGHSFWHDDLWDEREWKKYDRRVQRLLGLRAQADGGASLLFVRAASHSAELADLGVLHDLLVQKFGSNVNLLFLLNYQPSDCAVFLADRPRLVIATLGTWYDRAQQWVGQEPIYRDAIWNMLWYMQTSTRPRSHVELESLDLVEANLGILFQEVDLGEDPSQHWTPFPSPFGEGGEDGDWSRTESTAAPPAGEDAMAVLRRACESAGMSF